MHLLRKHLKLGIAMLVAGLMAVVIAPHAIAKPDVRWEPKVLNVELVEGETRTIEVVASTSDKIKDARLRLTPGLERIASVTNQKINFSKRGTTTISITLTADEFMLPEQIFEGTLQVREDKKVIAKPLPIRVVIVEATGLKRVQSEAGGFSVSVPTAWEVNERDGALYLSIPRTGDGVRYTPDIIVSSFSMASTTGGTQTNEAIVTAAGIHPLDVITTSSRGNAIYVEAVGYAAYNLIAVPSGATSGVIFTSGNAAVIDSPDVGRIVQSLRLQ